MWRAPGVHVVALVPAVGPVPPPQASSYCAQVRDAVHRRDEHVVVNELGAQHEGGGALDAVEDAESRAALHSYSMPSCQ